MIQVLFPLIRYLSPFAFPLVFRWAKSEPISGSEKTAVGKISPLEIFDKYFCFCSSLPPIKISSAAISDLVPSEPTPTQPLESSSETIHIAFFSKPRPPYSSGIVRPKTPKSDIFFIISRGI